MTPSCVLLLCLLTFGAGAYATEVSEFPNLPNDALLDATAPDGGKAELSKWGSWRGDLGFRLHYAGQDQLDSFAFKRSETGITSMRADLLLEGDMPVGDMVSARASARLSRELATADGKAFSEAKLEQAYLDFHPQGNWRLKIGRQLAPLGSSDYFQLLDVVNPRDERTMGLVDLKESRLPVFATRIGYERKRSGAELILKHEFRPHRYGQSQSDFDPFIALGGGNQVARRDAPNLWRQPDLVLHAYTSEPWGDLHAVLARMHEATPMPIGFENGGFVLAHQRSNVVGVGGNYVQGDWVLKSELSRRSATRQLRADLFGQLALPTARVSEVRPQSDWMVGVRYTGIPGFTVDAEWLTQLTGHHDASLAEPKRRQVAMMNLEWSTLHDKLRLGLLLGRWWGSGKVLRANAAYDLDDRWQISLGLIQYVGGGTESPLFPYGNNDRFTLSAKFSF